MVIWQFIVNAFQLLLKGGQWASQLGDKIPQPVVATIVHYLLLIVFVGGIAIGVGFLIFLGASKVFEFYTEDYADTIAVACSAVCFIAAIRVYCAPTSPCSGCSLSWCSHLPPSRHCFTWVHAISPNYDGWPQAPVIRRADLLHRLRQTRQFLLRCHASSCFLFSCVFMPALLLWLYRQWLSVLPFRP